VRPCARAKFAPKDSDAFAAAVSDFAAVDVAKAKGGAEQSIPDAQ
jgi:hypothetical protein